MKIVCWIALIMSLLLAVTCFVVSYTLNNSEMLIMVCLNIGNAIWFYFLLQQVKASER